VLNIYKEQIDIGLNTVENMVAIGMKTVDTLPFPPEVNTIPKAAEALAKMIQSAVRNAPEGCGYSSQVLSERHLIVLVNMPYPDEAAFGYLWAVANRFKPPYNLFSVRIVPNPFPDKHPGTAFQIKWGTLPSDVD